MVKTVKNQQWERENQKTPKPRGRKWAINHKQLTINTLSDKKLKYVSECQTTLQIMSKLNYIYSTKSTALQMFCRNQIEKLQDSGRTPHRIRESN